MYATRRDKVLFAASLCGAAALVAALVLTAPLNHDEHMYVAAGVLVGESTLYRDFAYFQTPYLPYAYHAVFASVGGDSLLLSARIVSAGGVVVICAAVWGVARRLGASPGVATALMLIVAGNHLLLGIAPLARNHVPALAASVVAIWLALRALQATDRGQGRRDEGTNGRRDEGTEGHRLALQGSLASGGRWWWLLAGAAGGLAAGLRLTHAPLLIPIVIAALWPVGGRSLRQRLACAGWIAIGALLALAPAAWVMQQAGWSDAWFCNVAFHGINEEWAASRPNAGDPSTLSRVSRGLKHLLGGNSPMLLAGMVFLFVVGRPKSVNDGAGRATGDQRPTEPSRAVPSPVSDGRASGEEPKAEPRRAPAALPDTPDAEWWARPTLPAAPGAEWWARPTLPAAVLLVGSLAVSLAVALWPSPTWPDYYAAPFVMLALVAAALVPRSAPRGVTYCLSALAVASLATGIGGRWGALERAARPERWTHRQVEATAARVRAAMSDAVARVDASVPLAAAPIATVAPLYVLEGGLTLAPEFATGPFLIRNALSADPRVDKRLGLFRRTPSDAVPAPPAMLLGADARFEERLRAWESHGGYTLKAVAGDLYLLVHTNSDARTEPSIPP